MLCKYTVRCSVVILLLGVAASAHADLLNEQPVPTCDNIAAGEGRNDHDADFCPAAFQVLDDFILATPVTFEDVNAWDMDELTARLFLGAAKGPDLVSGIASPAGGGGASGYAAPRSRSLDSWAYNYQSHGPAGFQADDGYGSSANISHSSRSAGSVGADRTGGFGSRLGEPANWPEAAPVDAGSTNNTVVPEPSTITLIALGISGYLISRWRQPRPA